MSAQESLTEVYWESSLVGFFEFLALGETDLIGYWCTAKSTRARDFRDAVRAGDRPPARLGRGGGARGLFLAWRIEPGRRWRGDQVEDVEVLYLRPVASRTAGLRPEPSATWEPG